VVDAGEPFGLHGAPLYVPQYRRKGLAAAALSELYRRMKPLGATHMTGGGNPFYEKIGFEPCIGWTFWEKPEL